MSHYAFKIKIFRTKSQHLWNTAFSQRRNMLIKQLNNTIIREEIINILIIYSNNLNYILLLPIF